jgi:hypothetical protein
LNLKTITAPLFPSFLWVLGLLFASCGSSPASIIEDMISEMNAMKAILEGIESQEDYDRVKEELESSKARLQELGEQLEKLDITDEEKMESSREYSPQMLQALLEIGNASIKAVEFGFTLEAPAAGL